MTQRMQLSAKFLVLALTLVLLGCKSYWIDVDVLNQTGQQIRQLEVDYPTASFGINSVGSGSQMHYRFQVRGSGPISVTYVTPDGKTIHLTGPTLAEHQHGQLTIRLLSQAKSEFIPNIQPVFPQPAP